MNQEEEKQLDSLYDFSDLDEDDLDDLLGEDEYEDGPALAKIREAMPAGWHMVKLERFTTATLKEMRQWVSENCIHQTKQVGWYSNCAYMVAVQFQDTTEAILFKLRWA